MKTPFRIILLAAWLASAGAAVAQIQPGTGGSSGGGGGSGTVTNIATSCGVSGGPITTTGTIQGTTTVNPQTGANYAFLSTDCGKLVNLSNASNQIPTIPSGATLGAGWFTEACNQGAGTQTITPAGGTIGGASTYVLAAGSAAAPKCVGIVSDGTNLQLDMTGVGGATGALLAANNLSDVANAPTSVVNLGASPLLFKTYIAGKYYTPMLYGSQNALVAGGTSVIKIFPIMVPQKVTISELFVRINTTVAGNWQAAVYAADPSTLLWTGTPLAKSNASASTAVSGGITSALAANLQLLPGNIYWIAFACDNATATFVAVSLPMPISWLIGDTLANVMPANGQLIYGHFFSGQTFGTWPDLTSVASSGPLSATSAPSLVGFKAFSVP